MEKFIKKNWLWIVITIVSLIVLVAIYYRGKKAGKGVHLKKLNKDIIGSELSDSQINILKSLAEKIHDDIFCFFCFRNEDLYKQVSNLSNNELGALNNIYNEFYEIDDNETFYQALDNEVMENSSFELAGLVSGILSRLNTIN